MPAMMNGTGGVGTRFEKPNREYNGYPLGAWMFYPNLFAGLVYNDNVNQTNTARVSSWGERVVPSFSARRDGGMHQTEIYGLLDAQNFSASGVSHTTTADAKAGFTHRYEAQRDLTFSLSGDYTRQLDVFGATAFAPADSALSAASQRTQPTTVSPQINPDRYNQFTGSAMVSKTFNRAFINAGFSAQRTTFDSNPNVTTSRDGNVYTLTTRAGFNVTPRIYAFFDPSFDWRRYTASANNSHGYRMTGGFGTGNGIWQAELYGGYQAEKNDTVGTYSSDVFGARILYSPTRMWTIRAVVDQTLGASTVAANSGQASRATTALVAAGYNGLPQGWTANARFGYVHTGFINSTREDNGWLVGANIGYLFWRNFGLTLDYQFKNLNSNVTGQSFYQHVVSAGLSYRY